MQAGSAKKAYDEIDLQMPNGWQLGVGDENGSDECGMMNDE
jgi:hypothetical protein